MEKQGDGGGFFLDGVNSPKNHYQPTLSPSFRRSDLGNTPFSDFPSEHQTPIDYTDFNLEDFANWLNDRGPRDIYENTNNVLIVVSENQNMTNIQILNDC